MFYLQRRHQSGKRMTDVSRYLVEVSLSSTHLHHHPRDITAQHSDSGDVLTLPFPVYLSVCLLLFFLRAAPADVLAAGRRRPGRGGGAGSPLLPGSEQEAVEPTDVPGRRSGGHLPARRPEPGEDTTPQTHTHTHTVNMSLALRCTAALTFPPMTVFCCRFSSQDELESYVFKSIFRCDAVNTEKLFPSLLLLVCQSADQTKPDIHFFNCETVKVSDNPPAASRGPPLTH